MRLVTRSDFDGLASAMILKEMGMIDEIVFVQPKDIQDNKFELFKSDILTNLPFNENAGMIFDHHLSEEERLKAIDTGCKLIIDSSAKSAARIVYNYYGGSTKLTRVSEELMNAVDKGDSAEFSLDDVLYPKRWDLLHFITDARTGLGRFHDFTISNYDLMMKLIDFCLEHSIDEVLELPDVKERVDFYFKEVNLFKEQLERVVKVDGKTAVFDLRNEEIIHAGNRFIIYALYPEVEYSMYIVWGKDKENTAVMIGKSIFNKDGNANVGSICLAYGGGGHYNAGSCRLKNDKADILIPDIVKALSNRG